MLGGGGGVMIERDWTLKNHFEDGLLPEEILQALMPHENGQSSQAVEIERERERGKERERERVYQPQVALMQANSCVAEKEGLADTAMAYGLSLHHSIADRMDLSTHVCTQTHIFAPLLALWLCISLILTH